MEWEYRKGFLEGKGEKKIFYRYFCHKSPRATLLVFHGFGEHSGRHLLLARTVAEQGFSVLLWDQRGHGHSGGRRGHIDRFETYLEDAYLLVKTFTPWPLVVFGHSMGGLVALYFGAKYPHLFEGLAVSSPFLDLAMPIPSWKKWLAPYLASLFPTLTLPSGLPPEYLSHDPEVVKAYEKDPLVHRLASAKWFEEVRRAQQLLWKETEKLTMPLLFQVAGSDHICSPTATLSFFESLPSKRKEFYFYPALYHEVFLEVPREREIVYLHFLRWLERLF